jgi:hypothetical protein
LSIFYWLKDDVLSSYPTVTIKDGFPGEDLEIPSVSVESHDIRPRQKELGNRRSRRQRMWSLEIIASNKAQRDELTSIILNDLEYGIPVYDYDEGFPPSTTPSELGLLRPIDWEVRTIRIFPELVEKLYWRNTIRFFTEYNAI